MEQNTAKQFALQLGSLVSLYLSLGFFLALVFGLVTLMIPDTLDSTWQINSAADSIRIGFAMTVVFFPTYLYLTRQVNKSRRAGGNGQYLGLTKWLIYLSLLVGGAVLLGDLVAIIMGFLEGELTERFLLQALAVLVVAGSAFWYYAKDVQGYWLTHERQSIWCGAAATIVITATLLVGLTQIDTPGQVRDHKQDQETLNDLQDIQWAVQDYLYTNERLPETIMVAYENRGDAPQAATGLAPYTYSLTGSGFELCAEFHHTAEEDDRYYPYYDKSETGPHIINPDDWYYETGVYCFQREVRF